MHPLTPTEISFANELIKRGFKIPSVKEAVAKRKSDSKKKKRKLSDMAAVDRVIAKRSTPSGSIEHLPQKTTSSQKKAKAIVEEDTVTLMLLSTALAYSDTFFLEGVVGVLFVVKGSEATECNFLDLGSRLVSVSQLLGKCLHLSFASFKLS